MTLTVSSSQKYRVTFILIALNVFMYIYISIEGGDFFVTQPSASFFQLAQYNALVFKGAYYQLLTSMFIHGNIVHLGGNMLFLLVFGLRGEQMFSLPEYLSIYILGNVNYLAHIGGLAAGIAFGYIIARRRKPQAVKYQVSYSYSTIF
jgi:membrane associated rhomboid family serine protease